MLLSTGMLAGLLCAIVLLGALFVQRVGVSGAMCVPPAALAPPTRSKRLGFAVLALGAFPLLSLAPWLRDAPLTFWGDTLSHARVASEIARTALPHGWLDSYVGGFPFGHHYPPLGWLLLAAAIEAGLSPASAVYLLGFSATIAFPLVVYLGLVRCAIRPGFAGVGAMVLCGVSPYNPFIGGLETFFVAGLVSQAVAMPLCAWLAVAAVNRRNRWEAPLAVWLSMASHPQITVAVLVVLGFAVLASAHRKAIVEGLWTSALALIAGASLYAQGIATLDIPFGWPPDLGWRQFGFPPTRLWSWLLDGELLDLHRAPVITALLAAASFTLLLHARGGTSRALLVALGASLLLAVSGRWLQGMGHLGAILLSFLQPLRVVSVIPPLAAVCVVAALELATLSLQSSLRGTHQARFADGVPHVLMVIVVAFASLALPSRLRVTNLIHALQQPTSTCIVGERTVVGYDRDELKAWVATLRGAKLWYEAHQTNALGDCLLRDGIDLASEVPIGTAASVGAHVGVLARAAQYLQPERPGSAARAEALGIGYLLLENSRHSALPGWTVRRERGDVQLLSQPAQAVGVGCIARRWSGSPDAIRKRTNGDLADPQASSVLLDPHAFTAIAYATGRLSESRGSDSECDFTSASVAAVIAEAGAVSAVVQSATPVDVVFRVSAFPTWKVLIDDAPSAAPTLLAPGFFSVRMPPGEHRLVAQVTSLPQYHAVIGLAAMATAVLAWLRGCPLRFPRERFSLARLRRR